MAFSEENKLTISAGLKQEYSTPIANGGKYLSRTAMNAIANLCLQGLAFHSYGGYETFRSGMSYPLGAILSWYVGDSIYLVRSTKANNSDNFVENSTYIGNSWSIISALGKVMIYPRINIESYRERTYTIKATTGYTAQNNIMWIIAGNFDWMEIKPSGSSNWTRINLKHTITSGNTSSTRWLRFSFYMHQGDSLRLNKDATLPYYGIRER